MKYLGNSFDVHNGGVDLIFPHHSNEIAQSQALSNKVPFVRYWIHAEHMMINDEKMSKSKNNFYTLRDIEKEFDPLAYRYLCLGSHYRSKMNFSWRSLESSQKALERLRKKMIEFKKEKEDKEFSKMAKEYKEEFLTLLDNDIDTPKALALTWKMIESKLISNGEKYSLLLEFDKVLGLNLREVKKLKIPSEIIELSRKRELLRKQKKWEESDEIRKKIESKGYKLEDTGEGTKVV